MRLFVDGLYDFKNGPTVHMGPEFGYWVLGIGGGSILAFYYDMGGLGLWWGLASGLAVAACLLSLRFYLFTRPRKAAVPV